MMMMSRVERREFAGDDGRIETKRDEALAELLDINDRT